MILNEPLVRIRLRKNSRSQNRDETLLCALEALKVLEKELPALFLKELSEKAGEVGSELFKIRKIRKAREAFELAQRTGPPKFQHSNSLYRVLAQWCGQEAAEWGGLVYRSLIPNSMRRILRNQ